MEANNSQKMREALTKVKEWMERRIATRGFETSATFPTMLEDVVLPALSAPPRNCDVFETETERRNAFIDWYNEAFDLKGSEYAIETCDLKHDVDGILHEYINWLFAEAEGGA